MSGNNPDATPPISANGGACATATRSAIEKAIAAAALLTDKRWQQYRLVLLAVRSFYPDRSGTRLPLYIVVDRTTDIAALRLFIMRYFNAARISDHVMGQKLRGPRSECIVQDLTTANQGTFYWLRGCAYHRSVPAALPESSTSPSDEHLAGDTVFLVSREFAAEASAWGIVLDLGGLSR
jgi:hypothetical protein